MIQNRSTFNSISEKINELRKVKSSTEDAKKRKVILIDGACELYNKQLRKLDDEYNKLSVLEKNSFTLNIMLKVYFLVIMTMMITLYHH